VLTEQAKDLERIKTGYFNLARYRSGKEGYECTGNLLLGQTASIHLYSISLFLTLNTSG
jgi:hypothetical protein